MQLKPRKRPDRTCERCGKTYFRGNRLRVWTSQNPGRRLGWEKADIKLCTKCMGEQQARQAHRVVSARIVTIDFRKRKAG